MRWFVRGDIDGFFGLAIDNLVQLLLIQQLCSRLLGFPDEVLYGRVLPVHHERDTAARCDGLRD